MMLSRNDVLFSGFYGCQGIFENFWWEVMQDAILLGKLVWNY